MVRSHYLAFTPIGPLRRPPSEQHREIGPGVVATLLRVCDRSRSHVATTSCSLTVPDVQLLSNSGIEYAATTDGTELTLHEKR